MSWFVHVTIIVGLILAACGAQAQENALRAMPRVEGLYEQKAVSIKAGSVPPHFTGSASVAPARGFRPLVSIGLKGTRPELGHFCGGIVIAPRWVLTAAHCVTTRASKDGRLGAVEAGALQALTRSTALFRGQVEQVTQVIVHPDYKVSAQGVPENDIALLQLTNTSGITGPDLITEAQADRLIKSGDKLLISGWGTATFAADSPISANLLFAFVDIVDRAKCNQVYGGVITERMFCAGVGVADSCQGDSGGPAIGFEKGKPLLVGIVSWGAGCTQKKFPGVYVNVAKFRGWIDATIGQTN